jgi:hypothetical protein
VSESGAIVARPVCDAWTQLPGMTGNPSEALSSVAMAYQVSAPHGIKGLSLKSTLKEQGSMLCICTGANPTIVNYNASSVCKTLNSLPHFLL